MVKTNKELADGVYVSPEAKCVSIEERALICTSAPTGYQTSADFEDDNVMNI